MDKIPDIMKEFLHSELTGQGSRCNASSSDRNTTSQVSLSQNIIKC